MSAHPVRRRAAWCACLLLAACNSLQSEVGGGAQPRRLALLPFAGSMAAGDRELARELLAFRLRERGYEVQDTAATDRLLTEAGWLADAGTFAPEQAPLAQVCPQLEVDACVLGTGFDRSQGNFVLWRRHALDATLATRRADGTTSWRASARRTTSGGLVLQSGQVLRELQQQLDHGSAMETLALLDQLVDAVAATVPTHAAGARAAASPAAVSAALRAAPQSATVAAEAPATASVWVQLPGQDAVPMAHVGGRWVVTRDLPPDGPATLHVRPTFGAAATSHEVRR